MLPTIVGVALTESYKGSNRSVFLLIGRILLPGTAVLNGQITAAR